MDDPASLPPAALRDVSAPARFSFDTTAELPDPLGIAGPCVAAIEEGNLMYRLFHRLEPVAFGLVTASAVACAGILIVHRYGGMPDLDFALPQAVNAAVMLAPYGEMPGDPSGFGQMPTARKDSK